MACVTAHASTMLRLSMGLSDLTDAAAVHASIAEWRRIGRAEFLKKYGFRAARRFWLIDGDELFDSKAIVVGRKR